MFDWPESQKKILVGEWNADEWENARTIRSAP